MDLENVKDNKKDETDPLLTTSVRGGRFGKKRISSERYLCGFLLILVFLVTAIGLALGLGLGLRSNSESTTERLVGSIKTRNIMNHLKELQSIADKSPQKSRAVEYAYNESAEYVIGVLKENGYDPQRQYFTVPVFSQLSMSSFNASVSGIDFTWTFLEGAEYSLMRYSGSGNILGASLTAIEGGCSIDDFSEVSAGDVVLMNYTASTEDCNLYDRAVNAKEADVSGVIMMRQEDDVNAAYPPSSRVYVQNSTGIYTVDLPLLGASYQLGQQLLNLLSLPGELLSIWQCFLSATEE